MIGSQKLEVVSLAEKNHGVVQRKDSAGREISDVESRPGEVPKNSTPCLIGHEAMPFCCDTHDELFI